MKIYKKDEVRYVDGLLVDADGNVVSMDPIVVHQLNNLEAMEQQARHEEKQKTIRKAVSNIVELEEFKFESEHEITQEDLGFHHEACTPMLDKRAAESYAILKEMEGVGLKKDIDEAFVTYMPALKFAHADEFFGYDYKFETPRFDLKLLGDPTKLTAEDIIDVITDYCASKTSLELMTEATEE